VSAVAANAVGNLSERSNINHFTVDTTAPAAPVVTQPVPESVTNDNTPALTGTAEPNSTVTVSLNGSVEGTTTADASGAWSFTPSKPLPEGANTVVATATDAAGNTSAPSSQVRFFV